MPGPLNCSPYELFRSQFVARVDKMGELQMRYRRAAAGDPQFLVLLGPSGIGKTRIVQELYRWLTLQQDLSNSEFPHGYWPNSFSELQTSADVNPFFADPNLHRPPIPWLWWGLKFSEGPLHGQRTDEGDALWLGLRHLNLHLVAAAASRQVRAFRKDLLTKVALFGFEWIPVVGNIPGWIKDLQELGQGRRSIRDSLQKKTIPLAKAIQEERTTHSELAFESLKLCLDPHETDHPTIPVILWLDDAHWIDETTLIFVQTLWRAAQQNNWPLLIVATHWDHEWELHAESPSLASESPQKLRGFLEQLAPEPRHGIHLLHINAVPRSAAQQLLTTCFPGLPEAQQNVILDRAAVSTSLADDPLPGTNLRLLEQIVAWLSEDGEAFVDNQFTSPLREDIFEKVRHETWDIHYVAKKRFRRLEKDVQRALGWSSLQGERFLAQITIEACGRLAPMVGSVQATPTLQQIERGLRRAELPHSLIHSRLSDRQQGRFNQCEFRQRIFHEVAYAELTQSERTAVDASIDAVLVDWLRGGKLDTERFGTDSNFEIEEGRDALRLAISRLDSKDSVSSILWGNAAARLIDLDSREFLWDQALSLAIKFADKSTDAWGLDEIPFIHQLRIIDVLIDFRAYDRAARILQRLYARITELTGSPNSGSNPWILMFISDRLGMIFLALGQRQSARGQFDRSLTLGQRIVAKDGETRDTLRNLIDSLHKVGEMCIQDGDRVTARTKFTDALHLSRRIIDTFGATSSNLSDAIISLGKVGALELSGGNTAAAREMLEESLTLSYQLVGTDETKVQHLATLAHSLFKIGDLALVEGDRGRARTSYEKSLAITRQIVADFGAKPQSLSDEATMLERIGRLDLVEGQIGSARRLLEESLSRQQQLVATYGALPGQLRGMSVVLNLLGHLDLGEELFEAARNKFKALVTQHRNCVQEYGATPQSLGDLSVSLCSLGDLDIAVGNLEDARASFDECLKNSRTIVATFGGTLQGLRNLYLSVVKSGDLDLATGDLVAARSRFEESRLLIKRILREFGANSQSLRDLGAALCRIGDLEIAEGEWSSARTYFVKSLSVSRYILSEFGSTPQSLRDTSAALNRIGRVDLRAGNRGPARASLEEALRIRLRTLNDYGLSIESVDDASSSLVRVADLDLEEGLRSNARTKLEESLVLRRQMISEFGESPERLQAVNEILERLDSLTGS